ncbi:MAG: SIS domain-containing protein [Rheinheimera sp.]|nr:SIS domain-containing protein [Rheinheimera sp.]
MQGARRAFPVASYAGYLLGNSGRAVQVLDGVGYMQHSALNLMASDDVVLAISYAPYASETQAVLARARQCGAKIIAITDSRLSPLVAQANVALLVREAELHAFRSLNASMNLVRGAGTRVAARHWSRRH